LSLLRGIPAWSLALIVLVLDFVTKRIVLANVDALIGRIEVLGDVLRMAYVRNPGAAMGLALGGRPFLIAVSIVATVLLIVLYRRTSPTMIVRRAAMAVVAGGALGNLVDRIFYDGLVVDFIDVGIGTHRFWTFNVADMGVTVGGAVLFLSLWRESHHEDRADPAGDAVSDSEPPSAGSTSQLNEADHDG